jgi:hypothetical protein
MLSLNSSLDLQRPETLACEIAMRSVFPVVGNRLLAAAANALQPAIDCLVFLLDCGIAARLWTGRFRAPDARPAARRARRRGRRSRRIGGASAVGARRWRRRHLGRIARATWIVAGVIEPAGIGRTGWHAADASGSCSRRTGAWRAHRAAAAGRRPAGGSARACAAAALRERTGGTSKKRDCNNRHRHGYSSHRQISLLRFNDGVYRWFRAGTISVFRH